MKLVGGLYMRHPLGYTCYNVRYMSLFFNLDHANWTWGCVALTILYSTLGEENVFKKRQLIRYMSLFHV